MAAKAKGVKLIKPKSPPDFGTAIRNQEFNLNANVTFLNQGSYGSVPKQVTEELRR